MNDIVEFHLMMLRIAGILFVFIFGVPIGQFLLYCIILFSVNTYRIMKSLFTGRPAGEIIKFEGWWLICWFWKSGYGKGMLLLFLFLLTFGYVKGLLVLILKGCD